MSDSDFEDDQNVFEDLAQFLGEERAVVASTKSKDGDRADSAVPIIFHVDVDNFYVNVHRVHDASLNNKQVVVVQKNGGGIVALSEEAKDIGVKKYDGVAGNGAKMLGRIANSTISELKKKHPQLVVVEMDTDLYRAARDLVRKALEEITIGIVQGVSYDDSFIKMPDSNNNNNNINIEQRAFKLRRLVKKRVGYDVTIGVGSCKTVAKLAGALAKRGKGGNGVHVVPLSSASDFLQSASLREIKQGFGGKKGLEYILKLSSAASSPAPDITVRDALWLGESKLRTLLPSDLVSRLLLWGAGKDDDEVTPTQQQKSILSQQGCQPGFDEALLTDLCRKLVERVVEDGRTPKGMSIIFRDGYEDRGNKIRKVGKWRREFEENYESLFAVAKTKFGELQGISFTKLGVRAEFDDELTDGAGTSSQNIAELFKKDKERASKTSEATTTTTTTTKTKTKKRSLNITAGGKSALDLLKAPTKEDIRGNGKRWKGLDQRPTEFKFLVVLDYEWTCDDKKAVYPHAEIIEWGCVLVDMERPAEIVSKFQEFVKPKHNPTLTTFCKDLTAITQKQVDEGSSLDETIAKFETWLRGYGVQVNVDDVEYDFADSKKNPLSYAIVTWSDADLGSTLNKQMMGEGLRRRRNFESWINLKVAYKRVYGREPHGLRKCVEAIGVKFEGRAHSGLVDAENTAAIVLDMVNQQSYKGFTSTTRFLDVNGTMIGAKGKAISNIAMAVGNTNIGEEGEGEEEMDEQEKQGVKAVVVVVEEEEESWSCPRCTFSNTGLFLCCEICGSQKNE
ncbi:hypothetical protein TrLO_g8816 [Triparma laevis f. longispina]|uniref:Exonuclease domain-containing protein n=1 Tax=Triparma laevis f. longispina TaxID=1714387 RepID=A0A9W7E5I6_9STRA|nr:hypothetical protein TrLO_g8816 [Triparma laevis f. longispina]